MDLHRQMTDCQAHGARSLIREDLFDHIHFNKVVSSTQRAELRSPALLGSRADG